MSTLYINNIDIKDYNAHLLDGYTIGGVDIDSDYFQGRNRTSFRLISQSVGMKEIEFSLEFEGETRRDIMLRKSAIDALFIGGKVDLYLPDKMHYMSMITSIGGLSIEGVDGRYVVGKATYKANGIAHDDLVTYTGAKLFCRSTAPMTDCIVECTLSKAYSSITIGNVTFTNVKKGAKIKVDGINGRILIDGAPAAGNFTFTEFPHLVPEWNALDTTETLTVSYYPTYI